ncbi:MAG: HAMP domain-containing protein [Deltaproteobacteria bacterium]|nr:HAMP domain-containing protein [Deltaproteobacteria bacterium]
MTLRSRILIVIASTLVVALVLLHGTVREIVRSGFMEVERDLLAGFARIEQTDTRQHAQRARDALQVEIENLSVKAADWAQWDDTYRFVVDRNPAYVSSNLKDTALSDLKLNFLAIIGPDGIVAFRRWYDLEAGEGLPVPASLGEQLRPGRPLLLHRDVDDAHSGILLLPEGPLMVVSRPITTSEGKGPLRGSVVFGRMLDATVFERLGAVTHLTIRSERADRPLSGPFAAALGRLGSDGILVEALGADRMAGYSLVRDFQARPALLLRVDVPREIYRQGLLTQSQIQVRAQLVLLWLVVSILTVGLLLGGVILFVLEGSVLRRLARLSKGAVGIGRDGDFSARLETGGRDEISRLAQSINTMLADLAASHRTIEARNAQLRLIMDSVPSGLLSLDEELRVQAECSRSAERLLQEGMAGRSFVEVLGLPEGSERDGLRQYLEVFERDLVPEDSMAELNPLPELRYGDGDDARWLRLDYRPIRRGREATNLLVIVEDITREKILARRAAETEQENLYLRALAEDPDLFGEVLFEGHAILRTLDALAAEFGPSGPDTFQANEMFRGVHTIKGAAASFSMNPVTEAAARVEDRLEAFRRADLRATADPKALGASLQELSAAFMRIARGAARLLGDTEGERNLNLRVSAQEIAEHIRGVEAAAKDVGTEKAEVRRMRDEAVGRLRSLRTVPAPRALARSVRLVTGLAERLSKDVEFRFEGDDTRIDVDLAPALNRVLLHLLRNALDHGIETGEERERAGKPRIGHLVLRAARENGSLSLLVSDDGRGLDVDSIRASAIRKGVVRAEAAESLSAAELGRIAFCAGVSTAREVTETSGRGVGLDDVLQTVERELGGEIRVESRPGAGTDFTLLVPMPH